MVNLRRYATCVLLLVLMPLVASAQQTGKLAGSVTDQATNEPLPGATVVIDGTQLGSATDANGSYFIIGVPVGTYNIRASFIGYESLVYNDVSINAGFTRNLDFALSGDTELLDEVVVEYERPIIQKDAIGVPKVVSGEAIQNLPVRGVGSVAALQGGVVADEGSGDLFVRGGREEEVTFFVDGVKVVGQVAVPQSAIQEQSMLIGSIPAKFGDAASGIISVTTKSGGSNFFGSLEGVTSEVLDSFGYNLGSFSVGGPLIRDKVNFFVAGELLSQDDRNPRAVPTARLNDNALNTLLANPQVLRIRNAETGAVDYLALPSNLEDGASLDEVLSVLNIPAGFELDSPVPIQGAEVQPLSAYEFDSAKRNYDGSNFAFNGNLTLKPSQSIRMRLGGRYGKDQSRLFNRVGSLFSSNRKAQRNEKTWGIFGNWTQYLSNSTFYQVQVDFTDSRDVRFDPAFDADITDVLFYGDIDHPANETARRYKLWNAEDSTYVQRYSDSNLPNERGVYSVFGSPGMGEVVRNTTVFAQNHNRQLRVSASATTQIGLHQIEFGGEFEQRVQRHFAMAGGQGGIGSVARFYDDGNVENGADRAVTRWEELQYENVKDNIEYYGYNFLGTEEVNDQDVEAFVSGANRNIAPYQPIYYAGYIQDKIEYKDLVLNLGLRVDLFDNNALVLRDKYALLPIVRAGALSERPGNIGSDYAAYFNNSGDVVGYRDLEGNFFDVNGQEARGGDINILGTPQISGNGKLSAEVFEDYEPEVTVMPRIGLSFPVTDQALFFASYDVTSQRPADDVGHGGAVVAFDGIHEYLLASEGSQRVNNTGLKPVKTTEYELGFKQRLGERAAVTLSGFYKSIENLIQLEAIAFGFPNGYTFYGNNDFGTIKGAQFEFELRRTNNVSIDANYTLQFAEGTGSDAQTATQVAWRGPTDGTGFPETISPLDFDRRHSINLSVDYRLGKGEGPVVAGAPILENFGINVVTNLRSGLPFTRLQGPNPLFNSFILPPAGSVNGDNQPWATLVNLRVDRVFQLTKGLNLTAYLWIQNLLDADNVIDVYRATGLAGNDGWMSSGEGQDFLRNQEDPTLAAALYGFAAADPFNYGIPRQTRFGVRINF